MENRGNPDSHMSVVSPRTMEPTLQNSETPQHLVQQMVIQLQKPEGRAHLGHGNLEDTESRARENPSGRPGRKKTPRNLYAEGKTYSIRFQTSNFNAAGKTHPAAPDHVEDPKGPRNKEEILNEEGRADPADDGSASGEPRHEVSPKRNQRTARRARRDCPGTGSEEGPSRRRNAPIRPEVEVEVTDATLSGTFDATNGVVFELSFIHGPLAVVDAIYGTDPAPEI